MSTQTRYEQLLFSFSILSYVPPKRILRRNVEMKLEDLLASSRGVVSRRTWLVAGVTAGEH